MNLVSDFFKVITLKAFDLNRSSMTTDRLVKLERMAMHPKRPQFWSITCLWKFFSVFEIACLWEKSSLSMKCPVYSYLRNVLSLNFLFYKMSYLWNVLSSIFVIYEITIYFFLLNDPTPIVNHIFCYLLLWTNKDFLFVSLTTHPKQTR